MSSQSRDPIGDAVSAAVKSAQAAADAAARTTSQTTTKVQTGGARFEGLSYGELKTRESELQKQRQTLADRRATVAGTYENATGASKEGIAERLRVMDGNMARIESDLAAIGVQMVNTVSTTEPPPPPPSGDSYTEEDVVGVGFSVFFGTLFVVFVVRRLFRFRRGRGNRPAEPAAIQSNERLDRIEQAVDTIAVEIERVSENQRFMTRLMTETQLGASIAAVRSSTELAKSAADSASESMAVVGDKR